MDGAKKVAGLEAGQRWEEEEEEEEAQRVVAAGCNSGSIGGTT